MRYATQAISSLFIQVVDGTSANFEEWDAILCSLLGTHDASILSSDIQA